MELIRNCYASLQLDDLETVCPDKRWNQVKLLFSETSTEVLPLCEELVGKVLLFEHRQVQDVFV